MSCLVLFSASKIGQRVCLKVCLVFVNQRACMQKLSDLWCLNNFKPLFFSLFLTHLLVEFWRRPLQEVVLFFEYKISGSTRESRQKCKRRQTIKKWNGWVSFGMRVCLSKASAVNIEKSKILKFWSWSFCENLEVRFLCNILVLEVGGVQSA